MIRIAITVEAFDALASTLPFGSVGYENTVNERSERLIGFHSRASHCASACAYDNLTWAACVCP
jgi:hypothetical protein